MSPCGAESSGIVVARLRCKLNRATLTTSLHTVNTINMFKSIQVIGSEITPSVYIATQ